jgi:hypothetical protein
MLTDARITELRRHLIEGRFRRFKNELEIELRSPELGGAASAVKAALYRLVARAALFDSDIGRAKEFHNKAAALVDDEDANVLAADIIYHESTAQAALEAIRGHGIASNRSRALYMLLAGRAPEGLRILEAISDGASTDAEFQRVLALLRLANGQYAGAGVAVERAVQLDPRSFVIQQAAGIVPFFSCYPVAFLPRQLFIPFDPVPSELLNLDDAHIEMLRDAKTHFDAALTALDTDDKGRGLLELWRLAVLAVNPHTKTAAVETAKTLLSRQAPVDEAVQWSFMHKLDAHEYWVKEAQAALSRDAERPSQRLMLGWLGIESGNLDEAVDLLMSASQGESVAERTQRKVLLTRAFVEKQELDKADAALEGETSEDVRRLRAFVRELKAGEDNDSGPAAVLTQARQAAARGEWTFVDKNANVLLEQFRSRLAIRLVLCAWFQTKQYARFLDLYESDGGWTGLKHDGLIWRLYSLSLWYTGQRTAALAEMRSLFEQQPSVDSAHFYAYMLFESGDLNGIASIAPKVAQLEDLTPEIALEFAHALQSTHPHEGAILWDKAMTLGVPENLVVEALGVAYRVNREAQTESLILRMQDLAAEGKGGVTRGNYSQLLEVVKQSRERAIELTAKYRNGDIPIHLIADSEHLPLFSTHYIEPTLNRGRQPEYWSPIYVRAGNRPEIKLAIRDKIILLDTTSVIVAHYLGIFIKLMSVTERVIVPAETSTLLYRMRERLSPSQPGRAKYFEQLLSAINGRMITVVPNQDLVEWASNNNGYVISSIPKINVRTGETEHLDAKAVDVTINLRRLVETLQEQHILSSWDKERVFRTLASEASIDAAGPSPKPNAKLIVDAGQIELMQQAQLLRPLVTAGYELFITSDGRAFIQNEVQEASRRDEAATQVQTLIDTFRDGLLSAKVQPLTASLDLAEDRLGTNARALGCLTETASPDNIVVIDDRFCNRLEQSGTKAIVVSVFDCLSALQREGDIDDDTYYHALQVARASGMLFIPVTSEEIIYHLYRAPIQEGSLVETSELRTIRQYIGGSLRQPGLHVVPYGNYDEREYVRSLDDALALTVATVSENGAMTDYLLRRMEAAELSAIRKSLDAFRFAEAMVAIEELVRRLSAK